MAISVLSNRLTQLRDKSLHHRSKDVDMKTVASVILGGGEGTRLHPLTLTCCKPAITFGGKYRLIDVPVSNSIHANCYKIFILTQYLSSSLHHHIFQTYMQQGHSAGMVEILTAEQKPSQKNWFQGTADAVRQNIAHLLETPVEYFLILSGDQLYNVDFREMVQFAKQTNADVVVATLPVTEQEAKRMGIMKIDSDQFITEFQEKPQDQKVLQKIQIPSHLLKQMGISADSQRNYLGSMGIYLFKRKVLVDLLNQDLREDFGKHLLPSIVTTGKAAAFLYNGYWEDIGTIETFYQANLALTKSNPLFNLYTQERSIFTHRYDLPPAKFHQTQLKETILCEGSVIEAEEISNSLLGPRSMVQQGSIIHESYLMGNDYYSSAIKEHNSLPAKPQIGKNCIIKRAIIDKNVHIGNGVQLINKNNIMNYSEKHLFVRDGIIVIPRGTHLPDHFIF